MCAPHFLAIHPTVVKTFNSKPKNHPLPPNFTEVFQISWKQRTHNSLWGFNNIWYDLISSWYEATCLNMIFWTLNRWVTSHSVERSTCCLLSSFHTDCPCYWSYYVLFQTGHVHSLTPLSAHWILGKRLLLTATLNRNSESHSANFTRLELS